MIKRLCLPLLAVSLFPGCTAHVYNVPSEQRAPVIGNPIKGTVFVEGDEVEGRILRESGIVSEAPGRMVHLSEFTLFTPQCGMPFLASAMTLGVVPAVVPARAHAEISTWVPGGEKVRTVYSLQMISRYSLWEGLLFRHNGEKVEARALGWAYKEKRVAP